LTFLKIDLSSTLTQIDFDTWKGQLGTHQKPKRVFLKRFRFVFATRDEGGWFKIFDEHDWFTTFGQGQKQGIEAVQPKSLSASRGQSELSLKS
jgi:hypothetical protein